MDAFRNVGAAPCIDLPSIACLLPHGASEERRAYDTPPWMAVGSRPALEGTSMASVALGDE